MPTIMTNEPNQDVREIQQAIDLSFQVEAFLQGPIGRYLIQRAEAQIEEALDQLKHVDPENASQIRAIQHNIHVAEDFQYWLAEAIQAGHNAAENFMKEQ